jgi:hypothetical protein
MIRNCDICFEDRYFFYFCSKCKHEICLECKSKLEECCFCRHPYPHKELKELSLVLFYSCAVITLFNFIFYFQFLNIHLFFINLLFIPKRELIYNDEVFRDVLLYSYFLFNHPVKILVVRISIDLYVIYKNQIQFRYN